MRVAFDIDDTLLVPAVATGFERDTPNYDTVALYKWFQAQGCEMILWSGSGMDWAQTWGEKLGLAPFTVLQKEKREDVDIAFDDCEVDLARVNVRVNRLNNGVSRKDWNETKTPECVCNDGMPRAHKPEFMCPKHGLQNKGAIEKREPNLCTDPELKSHCSGCSDPDPMGATHQGCTIEHGHVGCDKA